MSETSEKNRDLIDEEHERRLAWCSGAVAVIATVLLFYFGLFTDRFNPDNWAYIELSDTVFGDFFRVTNLRQFERPLDYSNSFPPLWPILIAVTRRLIVDRGIYTSTLLNFCVCVAFLSTLCGLFRSAQWPTWLGSVAYLILLAFKPFALEAVYGGTMPLSLLFATLSANILVRCEFTLRTAMLLGALSGLSCLTRFDFSFAALLIAFLIGVGSGGRLRSWCRAGAYLACAGILVLPWALYNIEHFGRPFASDNSRQAILNSPSYVTVYYGDQLPPTIRTDPIGWLSGLVFQKARFAIIGVIGAIAQSWLPALVAVSLAISPSNSLLPKGRRRSALFVAALFTTTLWVPQLVVGYGAISRYYASFVLFVSWIIIGFTADRLDLRRISEARAIGLVAIIGAAACWNLRPDVLRKEYRLLEPATYLTAAHPTTEMLELADALRRDAGDRPMRVMLASANWETKDNPGSAAARFGAQTKILSSQLPGLRAPLADFIREFGVTHVFDPKGIWKPEEMHGVRMVNLPYYGLARIEVSDDLDRAE